MARSGEQALSAIEQAEAGDPFDIVVLDYQMPDMDGPEVAKRILADERRRASTVVVMLSSVGQRGEAKSLAALGVAAYLTKPMRQEEILSGLAAAWEEHLRGPSSVPLVSRRSLSEARKSEQLEHTGQAANGRARVLLVEDNRVNQKLASRMLDKLGCEVDLAVDGLEAVDLVGEAPTTSS